MTADDINNAIEKMRDEAVSSQNYIERVLVIVGADGILVEGNQAGLLELSRAIFNLAEEGVAGGHIHVDGSSFGASEGKALIVSLVSEFSIPVDG